VGDPFVWNNLAWEILPCTAYLAKTEKRSFSRNLVMVRAAIEARCACQLLTGKAKAIPENCRPRELSVLARIEMPQRGPVHRCVLPAIALCNKL